MRAAVYRLLYGEDFIERSIRSVLDEVDQVWVFHTDKPWGEVAEVEYRGEVVKFPEKFDNALDIVRGIGSDKIRLVEHYSPTPKNQYTNLVNEFVDADVVMLIEADQVVRNAKAAFGKFERGSDPCACLMQVEYWKTPRYRIPYRNRPGPILWRTPMAETGFNGAPLGFLPRLEEWADNYGFCMSERGMYWKHLTALAFSRVIGDSQPREDWYEDVWLKWTPENNLQNLEPSEGHPRAILCAYAA